MWGTMKKKIIIPLLVVVVLLIGAAGGVVYVKSWFHPVNANDTDLVSIEIPMGSTTGAIATLLAKNQVIQNAFAFKLYTKWIDKGTLQAGSYQLSPSMTMEEIVEILKGGKVLEAAEYKITIPEGWQLKEIAARIAEFTKKSPEEILQALNEESFVQQVTSDYPSEMTKGIFTKGTRYALEGYLYPATYFYYEDPSTLELNEIIQPMLDETEKIYEKYAEKAQSIGLNFHELLTLSSMIEEEATKKADRKKISSVFHNRMNVSMSLQSCPTVFYAMDHHKDRLLYSDLETESPYNTYREGGLPIGPIANAGESSIEAAIYPEDTNYFYFLANEDGETFFSEDFANHKELKGKYIN